MTKDRTSNSFLDKAEWEEVQRKGQAHVKAWIKRQLSGTSVTVVLIGSQTFSRPYVLYEIEQSLAKGNGLVGIYIHGIKDRAGLESVQGDNPLDLFEVPNPSGFWSIIQEKVKASEKFKTYFWIRDDGYSNMNAWIEEAANIAER